MTGAPQRPLSQRSAFNPEIRPPLALIARALSELPLCGRSEPQLGSWSLRLIHDRLRDDWVVDLLLEPLIAWNNWTWAERRAPALHATGDGVLLSLGSSATSPPGRDTPHTLAAARYESGLDNSPMSAPLGPPAYKRMLPGDPTERLVALL